MAELIPRLTAEEKLIGRFKRPISNAMNVETKKNKGIRNKTTQESKGPPTEKGDFAFDIKKVRCHNCNNYGHYKNTCTRQKKKSANTTSQETMIAEGQQCSD